MIDVQKQVQQSGELLDRPRCHYQGLKSVIEVPVWHLGVCQGWLELRRGQLLRCWRSPCGHLMGDSREQRVADGEGDEVV